MVCCLCLFDLLLIVCMGCGLMVSVASCLLLALFLCLICRLLLVDCFGVGTVDFVVWLMDFAYLLVDLGFAVVCCLLYFCGCGLCLFVIGCL